MSKPPIKRQKLLEDLNPGDLRDLVKHTIEIDAFKPKIDEKNIVVTFYVREENPAYDLSRFIEFTSKNVVDTEVSATPNFNGDYLLFVEFTKPKIAKKVHQLLKAVKYLTDVEEWSYEAYGREGKIIVK